MLSLNCSTAWTSAILILVSTAAFSQENRLPRAAKPDPRGAAREAMLAKYDKNKDGRLNKEEVETIARERLKKFDDNKDGKVDSVELKRKRAEVRKSPQMDALQRAVARDKALADAQASRKRLAPK